MLLDELSWMIAHGHNGLPSTFFPQPTPTLFQEVVSLLEDGELILPTAAAVVAAAAAVASASVAAVAGANVAASVGGAYGCCCCSCCLCCAFLLLQMLMLQLLLLGAPGTPKICSGC